MIFLGGSLRIKPCTSGPCLMIMVRLWGLVDAKELREVACIMNTHPHELIHLMSIVDICHSSCCIGLKVSSMRLSRCICVNSKVLWCKTIFCLFNSMSPCLHYYSSLLSHHGLARCSLSNAVSMTVLIISLCDSSILHYHLMMQSCMALNSLYINWISVPLPIWCWPYCLRNERYPRNMFISCSVLSPCYHSWVLSLITLIIIRMLTWLRDILLWVGVRAMKIWHCLPSTNNDRSRLI